MNLNVTTQYSTKKPLLEVFSLFNKDMFYFLTKNGPVQPIRYDGDEIGDEVHLDMLFPWKDKWVSVITAKEITEKECYFVDEGKVLPFGIKTWKHKHIVKKSDDGVTIIDEIEFSSKNWLLDRFWFISFLPQFLARKKQYKQYLNRYEKVNHK